MFTGLVTAKGSVVTRAGRGPGMRLSLRAEFPSEAGDASEPLTVGESIAVDGCCLSVVAVLPQAFEVDCSAETVARTTLGQMEAGGVVNLERAVRAGDRLGGHLMTGHVDGVGELVDRRSVGEWVSMSFAIPQPLSRFVAGKGSIALNGVSLTVNEVTGERFDVMLIPITLAATNLGSLVPGDRVNVEVDLIARYVARLIDGEGKSV
jgi:riboflavin synthase